MILSVTINGRTVEKAELDTLFQDLEDWVNTHKLSASSFEKGSVFHRHMEFAPKFGLCKQADPITVSGTAHSGWYPSDLEVKHQATTQNIAHEDGGSYPVVEVVGYVGMTNSDTSMVGLYKMCIGTSTDGGVTWTPLDGTGGTLNTVRIFGANRGSSYNYYSSNSQDHYITKAPGYYPKNFPSDPLVRVVAFFGGNSNSHGNPALITNYCIMFNAQPVDPQTPWGFITLDAGGDI